MKKVFTTILLLITFVSASGLLQAQLVTTDPAIPITNQAVKVIFDATLGSGGLAGYTGDVYAHTGVITENSASGGDWKYVMTSWGQNTPETKLTRIGTDLYELEITPSIIDYYGVPLGEQILQMAFVFRSDVEVGGIWLEGKTATGGDIFIDVFGSGLQVQFIDPSQNHIWAEAGDKIPIEVMALNADSILLYTDNILINKVAGNALIDTVTSESAGDHSIKAIAKDNIDIVVDSFNYTVREPLIIEPLPANVKDGINYIDDNTVILSLVAPGKEFIYVIGDFNDWNVTNDYQMKMTPDSIRFWIEINGLNAGQEYIFQYFIDGLISVADPYTDKTSDPWSDQYIPESVYPGLIDYPAGKTTGIASVLQTAQQPYVWEVDNFIPDNITDLIIYEMLIRDFTTQHTYQSLIDTLGYLEKLGVSAVELMPVNEFEGNSSWGYNTSFYFAPDKYYGNKNDLKKFIDECHKRGIAVIIDMVLNHSYDQSPLVQMYFDGNKPTEDNPWYNREHNFANPDAHWGNDLNHESEYTQALVDSINSYWMNEYKVDGFRFDFTKGFGNNFKDMGDPWGSIYDADRIALLKRMGDEIWERNTDAIIILEHLAENSEEKELANYGMLLWGNLNYNYSEGIMGYNSGGKSNFSWISYKNRGWNDPHVVGYMESHDEERTMYKSISFGNSSGSYNTQDTTTALHRIELASTFFYTIPGPKMIWQFGELGYDYSIDYNGRLGEKPVRWDYFQNWKRKYLHDLIGALIQLRIDNPAFETKDFTINAISALKRIKINSTETNFVILGNFDVQSGDIDPQFHHTGIWYNYLTGDSITITDINSNITLAAGEYLIYSDKKLSTPAIGTGLDQFIDETEIFADLYPNPAQNEVTIEIFNNSKENFVIEVFDISGKMIISVSENVSIGKNLMSLNISSLKSGFYFVRVHSQNSAKTLKLIVQ